MYKLLKQTGFGLVEVLVSAALLSGLFIAYMNYTDQQHIDNNTIEFMAKREQLRSAIIGQVLVDKFSCECFFRGAQNFPKAGIEILNAPSPAAIGRMHLPIPGNCNNSSIPIPLVTTAGIDGVKLSSARIKNIREANGAYTGDLEILLSTNKKISGTKIKGIRIPVGVHTTLVGVNTVSFKGCSMSTNQADFQIAQHFEIPINRSTTHPGITPPARYKYCGLAEVWFGGNDGGNMDRCEVKLLSPGVWHLSGARGNDDPVKCGMYCI